MKLRFDVAPVSAKTAMEEALSSEMLRESEEGAKSLYSDLSVEEKVELHYYELNVDKDSLNMRDLVPSGWVFVVQTVETGVFKSKYSIAYVIEKNGSFRFTHLVHGWMPIAVLAGLAAARSGQWRKRRTYSPAIVQFLGSRIIALWFRGAADNQDILEPLVHEMSTGTSFSEIKAEKPMKLIKQAAVRQKRESEFSNAPRTLGARPQLFSIADLGTS